MATRRQRKAKRELARRHSRVRAPRPPEPTIREAQEEIVNEQARRLVAIGGRFGELLAQASVLPPSAPRPGEEMSEYSSPLTDAEMEELRSLASEAREAAKLEGIRLMVELREVTGRLDPRTIIALASWINMWGAPEEYFEPANRGSEAKVELLTGVVVSQDEGASAEASRGDYKAALGLVDDVLAQIDLFLWADAAAMAQEDSSRAQVGHQTRARRLHVRGESYIEHAETLAREVFEPHEAALLDALGFAVDDLISFFHAEMRVVQNEVNRVREQEMERFRSAVERGMEAVDESESEALAQEARECLESLDLKMGRAMTFTVDQIMTEEPSLSPAVVNAMVAAFSTAVGACDSTAYTWPLDEHPLVRRPILALEDGYMVPLPGFIGRDYLALVDAAIVDAGSRALPSDYLAVAAERISLALMKRVFSGSEVHGSLYYRIGDQRYETDGLVLCENVAIVTEAKARSLSPQAVRGDTRRLQADLEDAITDGVEQGARLADLLLSGESVRFEDERGKVVLEVLAGRVTEVHVLNPHLTPILDLGSQPAVLVAAGVAMPGESAVPIFLNDLRVIVDCVESPADLIAYLRWRADQPLEQLLGFDEGDLFGAYLLNEDFRFLEGRPARLLGYYTTQFDDHYAIGIDDPTRAPIPRKMLPKTLARFVRSQCDLRADGWLDAACAALGLGLAGNAFVDVKARETAARARRKRAVWMLVYDGCALVGMPPEMEWREGLALTRSSMPSEVTHVVFVSENRRGHDRIRWAVRL